MTVTQGELDYDMSVHLIHKACDHVIQPYILLQAETNLIHVYNITDKILMANLCNAIANNGFV